jgi:hypothetical protein
MRHVRSTLLMGSIASVRAAGHFDAYHAALDPRHREVLLTAVAGMWIPLDSVWAHYNACDALKLSPESIAGLGRSTFDRIGGTLLGTMLRMAKEAGVTPWTVLPHLQRFWLRVYDGGGVRVLKMGPKEAHLEAKDVPILESHYYRNGLRGLVIGVISLFCKRAYVNERQRPRAQGTVVLRAQWA